MMNEQTPAIYIDVGTHDFCEAFRRMRPENFSYAGQTELYDYLVELADDCGQGIELDVVALCGDFQEFESMADHRSQTRGNPWLPITKATHSLFPWAYDPHCTECTEPFREGYKNYSDESDQYRDYHGLLCTECYDHMESLELDDLREETTVIELQGEGFIIQSY